MGRMSELHAARAEAAEPEPGPDPLYPRDEVDSDFGPTCPHCGREFTPDEQSYFDPAGYEMDCDGCDKRFSVEVYTSTSWTSSRKVAEPHCGDDDHGCNQTPCICTPIPL